ncbi:ABC transporter ATP-binding protein [Nocardioides sp. cx-169]|uniref:ABC transporter ATP-binding protein n=1 Tax=Nocardioides sp. cx-169 TaxID=2899080 RepID=UPI001E470464|nr:ABC transporter ATP-binding protein [Nocardioides sp. cx-169]MCD4532903.1 ABC transporter ATP-binding protein [Nocardioides sp. cx-169]
MTVLDHATTRRTHNGAIKLDSVTMEFKTRDGKGIRAVENTSVEIPSGQFVSVLGPSGCGKSTLLRVIAGLVTPTAGAVAIGGEKVSGPSRKVGIAFQSPVLFPWYTVAQNIAMPAKLDKRRSNDGLRERVEELLDMVKLSALGDKYPSELSGGMRQRVAIARSLITDPDVILMDEPFGALDAITREHMNDELLSIWSQSGATVFFITHDISEAAYMSDRVLVMSPRPGRVIADIQVDLPRPRTERTRGTPEFAALAADMRQYISH